LANPWDGNPLHYLLGCSLFGMSCNANKDEAAKTSIDAKRRDAIIRKQRLKYATIEICIFTILSDIALFLDFTMKQFGGDETVPKKKMPLLASLHRSMGDMLRRLSRKSKNVSQLNSQKYYLIKVIQCSLSRRCFTYLWTLHTTNYNQIFAILTIIFGASEFCYFSLVTTQEYSMMDSSSDSPEVQGIR
jgi:hypothetical protein